MSNHVILTEQGHILNFFRKQHGSTLAIAKYPKLLHNDVPPSRIAEIRAHPIYLYILTKDGEIYVMMNAATSKIQGYANKITMIKMSKPKLFDGSHVQRYTRIETGTVVNKCKILLA